MSKTKKLLLNVFLGFIGFALLVAIIFFAINPGIPTNELTPEGVEESYVLFPNGKYSGEATLGSLTGEGSFEFDTGEIYTGSWEKYDMNGKGKLTGNIGNYEGEFKNSQRDGKGVFVWPDGSKYDGSWLTDKMNGDGTLTTSDNTVYTGTFVNNVFSSGTIYIDNEVAKYTITISDGEVSNSIDVKFDNGVTYVGEFEDYQISGEGVMTFPKEGKYEGEFKAGKRSGKGIFTWNNGVKYDGNWENDLMDGYGTYTFKNGSTMVGTFDEGTLDGSYTYTNKKGQFTTYWEDGKCTKVYAK